MYYLTAFDDSNYFLWQTQVQHCNFVKKGIDLNNVICLVSYRGENVNPAYIEYSKKVSVTFVFYKDEIPNRSYVPSIRPNLFKRFFRDNPSMVNEYILLHDSDILIVNVPLYAGMKDRNMHLADTISYIGHKYLATCGEEVYAQMRSIFPGLTVEMLELKEKVSGGAQYFGRGHTEELWAYIEEKTALLYDYILVVETAGRETRRLSGSFPYANNIQAWTAGMWAELWGFWLHGMPTVIDEQLNFTTGISKINDVSTKNFYHNAGVEEDFATTRFYKQHYAYKNVYEQDYAYILTDEATSFYVEAIMEAKHWLLTLG